MGNCFWYRFASLYYRGSPFDTNKVIECAVVGSATHIVTGDRRQLLLLKNYQNIQIVTAPSFPEKRQDYAAPLQRRPTH